MVSEPVRLQEFQPISGGSLLVPHGHCKETEESESLIMMMQFSAWRVHVRSGNIIGAGRRPVGEGWSQSLLCHCSPAKAHSAEVAFKIPSPF